MLPDNCGHDPAIRLACCSASSVEPMPSPYAKRTLAEVEASADELAQKFMDYEPPTLTAFLLARIADDEAAVEAKGSWWPDGECCGDPIQAWRPMDERDRREAKAKRRIVEDCDEMLGYTEKSSAPILAAGILSTLASVYADHPDYRQEWKP